MQLKFKFEMIIFLPHACIVRSVQVLDDLRLGKQRLEAKQVYLSLTQKDYKWSNHPASKMFIDPVSQKPYLNFIKAYYNSCLDEWISRGKSNSMEYIEVDKLSKDDYPWFWGWLEFHYSHQASLFRKHPYYYISKFELPEKYLDLGYIWPTENYNDYLSNRTKKGNRYSFFNDQFFAPINLETSKNRGSSFEKLFTIPTLKSMMIEHNLNPIRKSKSDMITELLSNDIINKPSSVLIDKVMRMA